MIWQKRDYYRWRQRFAWLPRTLDQRRIWLEHYEYRFLPPDECRVYPGYYLPEPFRCEWFEEYRMADGFRIRCKASCCTAPMAPPITFRDWYREKPQLKVAQ